MLSAFSISFILFLWGFSLEGISAAQEALQTPSQKTKEAVDKLGQLPGAISKGLESLKRAVGSKLEKGRHTKTAPDGKSQPDNLVIPAKKIEQTETDRFSAQGKRDPFRPATMKAGTVSRRRENLSPLERFDLGQLKVVGVVWNIKEPRAMVEDSGGLGYIVKIGTPIGVNDGKIKAIGRNAIV
ncbi:MAG: pilus assembly protein PilP, partial [Gammaproteobacteria bacterium]